MSHGPSTFGIIITSSLWPISLTIVVMSSSTHGDSRLLTRVHSWVSPSSMSLPTRSRPARAASLRSTGTASSRLPSRMSTVGAMSGTLATIFSLEKSRKWIIRDGLKEISRIGSGAPIARGLPKSRGFRTDESPDRLAAEPSVSRDFAAYAAGIAETIIRDATVADAAAIAGIHIRAWQAAYRGMLADEILDG